MDAALKGLAIVASAGKNRQMGRTGRGPLPPPPEEWPYGLFDVNAANLMAQDVVPQNLNARCPARHTLGFSGEFRQQDDRSRRDLDRAIVSYQVRVSAYGRCDPVGGKDAQRRQLS